MAKLSAHGTELLRITRERTFDPNSHTILRDGTDLGLTLTIWEKETRAYMSDGKILEKRDVRFRPDQYEPDGRFHSYGWKLYGRLKPGVLAHEHVAKLRGKIDSGEWKTWKLDTGKNRRPVLISQARIIKAIQSDEYIGFCRECGAKACNVEPDATNYTCENCGKPAVYGAQEMLF